MIPISSSHDKYRIGPGNGRVLAYCLLFFHEVYSDGIISSLQESTASAINFPNQPWYNKPLEPSPVNNQYLHVSRFLPNTRSSMQPKSGSDPLLVSGGIALKPARAPTKDQCFMAGYTRDAFGRSSSRALDASSSETFGDEFLDFHSHVDPINKLCIL